MTGKSGHPAMFLFSNTYNDLIQLSCKGIMVLYPILIADGSSGINTDIKGF
jgi:hypothetical protein